MSSALSLRSMAGAVLIEDSASYIEQVTVQNFTTLGSSITISPDPNLALTPSVVTPNVAAGTAAFVIANASVNIMGLAISGGPGASLAYGIYASSSNVTITSVTVTNGPSSFNTAGIYISSWTTASYTNTVAGAHGLQVVGSNASVFASTFTNNSANFYAMHPRRLLVRDLHGPHAEQSIEIRGLPIRGQ